MKTPAILMSFALLFATGYAYAGTMTSGAATAAVWRAISGLQA